MKNIKNYLEMFRKMSIRKKICLGVGVLALLGITVSCNLLKSYPHDNFIEEFIEEIIEYKTGFDIDLTPFSPEEPAC